MDEAKIGELNADGSIKQDVRVSILSGKRTQPGDPMIPIKGTAYFYRLEAQEFRLLHDESNPELLAERKQALEAALADNTPHQTPIVQPAPKIDVKPTKDEGKVING